VFQQQIDFSPLHAIKWFMNIIISLTLGGNGSAGISGFFFMTIQLENNMGSYPNLVIKKKPEIPAEPFPPTIYQKTKQLLKCMFARSTMNIVILKTYV
jgi:hypothetical protein